MNFNDFLPIIGNVLLGGTGFLIGSLVRGIKAGKIKLPPVIDRYVARLGWPTIIDAYMTGQKASVDDATKRTMAVNFLKDIAKLRKIDLPDSVANLMIELVVTQMKAKS